MDQVSGSEGLLKNGARFESGKVGASLLLDGVSSYLEVPNRSEWDLGSSDFTIEFWVNLRSLQSGSTVSHPAAVFIGHD
jgi:hypothetical protein